MHSAVWHMHHVVELACSDDSWVKGNRNAYRCYYCMHTQIHCNPSLTVSWCYADLQAKTEIFCRESEGADEQAGKLEIKQAERLSHKLTCQTEGRQVKIQQGWQVSREAMRWPKKQHKQLDSCEFKVTGRPESEETDEHKGNNKTHQRCISQSRHTDKHTNVDVGGKVGRPVHPEMLWRRGEVSRYRVLLIHCCGGVLTLTSMQPKPLEPILGSLAQLCQEASKTASAARHQWCIRRIVWYSNICLILL